MVLVKEFCLSREQNDIVDTFLFQTLQTLAEKGFNPLKTPRSIAVYEVFGAQGRSIWICFLGKNTHDVGFRSGIGVALGIMVCMTCSALIYRSAMGGKQDRF